MTDQDFDFIRNLLKERSAIVLEPGKEYLVEVRLTPLVKQMNLTSISELVGQLRTQSNNVMYARIVEAMVTTETSFFRDHNPFEALRKTILPHLIDSRRPERSLTIWSAACSTGQEPYSLALLIREHFPELADWHVTILASDLSREVLTRAQEGRYNQSEINRGMSAALLVKHFEQHGTTWEVRPEVRRMVKFQEINLARSWPFMPRMDLVLLRNVMIYFDVESKKSILDRIARLLKPDGYLLLGSAETTLNLVDSFRRLDHLKSGFYQLAD